MNSPQENFVGNIPIPKIRKGFTQRDRDLFLKQTFKVIKDYFQKALMKLQTQFSEVDTDFTEIHSTKFITKIYYQGNIRSQCKIWIGGFSTSDSIAYSEGQFNIDMDNSFNEMISIEDDGLELKLKFNLNITNPLQNKASLKPDGSSRDALVTIFSPFRVYLINLFFFYPNLKDFVRFAIFLSCARPFFAMGGNFFYTVFHEEVFPSLTFTTSCSELFLSILHSSKSLITKSFRIASVSISLDFSINLPSNWKSGQRRQTKFFEELVMFLR